MPVRLSGLLAVALLPLVVAPTLAAEPPSALEISSEVRILKVPAGFCERVGIARDA